MESHISIIMDNCQLNYITVQLVHIWINLQLHELLSEFYYFLCQLNYFSLK